MHTIALDIGQKSYPIAIGPQLLSRPELLDQHIPAVPVLIVTSATVAPLYLALLRAALRSRRVAECILADGEQHKTLQSVSRVIDALVASKINRDGVLIALGGGVVGDIGGFAAACYQRGISFVQFPTTLLAQVDSSVGGKTGVNHAGGKNLIGAFHQPIAVIADIDTLSTLPDRELRAGVAEVIKYGCVWDPVFFEWLVANMPRLIKRDADALTYAVLRSCEIKAKIVGQDEREQGVRAILNFGHTFGHAIESATAYETYLHGEAVGIGMAIAADFSHRLGLIDAQDTARIRGLIQSAGLPLEAPRIGARRAAELMQMDKKVLAGNVRLVALEKIGSALVIADYAHPVLEQTLQAHFG